MTEAMYDLLYMIDTMSNTFFRLGMLCLFYIYIQTIKVDKCGKNVKSVSLLQRIFKII